MLPRKMIPLLFVGVGALTLLLLCVSVLSSALRLDCAERSTIIPHAPVFPGSLLRQQTISLDTESEARTISVFEVQNSFEDVIDFYRQNGTCSLAALINELTCHGYDPSFGKYVVVISGSGTALTDYRIDELWYRCGSRRAEGNE